MAYHILAETYGGILHSSTNVWWHITNLCYLMTQVKEGDQRLHDLREDMAAAETEAEDALEALRNQHKAATSSVQAELIDTLQEKERQYKAQLRKLSKEREESMKAQQLKQDAHRDEVQAQRTAASNDRIRLQGRISTTRSNFLSISSNRHVFLATPLRSAFIPGHSF